uniref:Sperm microtubule inner protein 8 n=1 Tax=Naja naja TaxID=35670 RepID=A0A8C6VK16_NAJNA
MAQALDLIPWPPDASPVYAAPAVLIPLEPKKSMLAGVKEHIYHPCLPTLRRMDMDTMVNRLTDQHCRTSTTCSKEDFQRATFTVGGVPSSPVPSKGMSELVRRSLAGRSRAGKLAPLPPSTNQEEWPSYTRAMQDWSRFVSAAGELPLGPCPSEPEESIAGLSPGSPIEGNLSGYLPESGVPTLPTTSIDDVTWFA